MLKCDVAAAVEALSRPGAVILVPTETVYGLVCDWEDEIARQRIYALKQREAQKPLAMFAADAQMAADFGAVLTPEARCLLDKFSPGPITVITPGEGIYPTIGIRIPAHELVLEILKIRRRPLASTSANASNMPNVLNVSEALAQLNGPLDLVIDGGELPPDAAASTVVNSCTAPVKILRSGLISEADIEEALKML